MSEASSDFRPRPSAVPPPRRRVAPVDRQQRAAVDFPFDDEPCYPLDPPLVDVRIPVKAPHATATAYSRDGLMHRYPNAEVGDDLHILFTEPLKDGNGGNGGKKGQSRLSPDVFVALKVPRRRTRADYDVDQLGPPDFVLEVVSRSTWKHDIGRKLDCYQQMGVRECLLFDVNAEDRAGTGKELWGFALTPRSRQPLEEKVLPNGECGVCSAVLGLVAYVAERTPPSTPRETWALTMRWHDPATATDIPDYDQSRGREAKALAEAQAERSRAEAADARAEAAERRVVELEERLRRSNDAP